MTSHYVRCRVRSAFETVFDFLSSQFGNIYARKFGRTGEPTSGIILGEQYFFRVESDAAILVTLEEFSSEETRIEIVSWAGGHGLFSISYGAHSDFVHDVVNFLERSGLEVTVEEEINYFDRTKSVNI